MRKTKAKLAPVCCECGSRDVVAEAPAVWSMSAQAWVMDGEPGEVVECGACEEIGEALWVEVTS